MLHVLPNNDSQAHERNTSCPCGGVVNFEFAEALFTHMAFDGRHLVEQITGQGIAPDKTWGVYRDDETEPLQHHT